MLQAGYLQQKKRSPTGLALVVLAHAGVLGALMLVKGPDIMKAITKTEVTLIEAERPPPPEPPPPQPEQRQQLPQDRITSVPPLIDRVIQGPVVPPLPPLPPQPPQLPRDPVVRQTEPPPPRMPPQRARANLGSYFTTDDYPAAALRAEAEGRTSFSLTIGPDGRVTNCTVTGSSGNSALDGATCRILRSRARYTPARDQNRNPISGQDRGSVTWRLPSE
jgi:protein TonB